MSQPEVATDPVQMRDLNRERGRLQQLVHVINRYESAVDERADLKEMIQAESDDELIAMARSEFDALEEQIPALEDELRFLLIPRDPEDERDAILEIRAGTGGDEASLFAGDLFRDRKSTRLNSSHVAMSYA